MLAVRVYGLLAVLLLMPVGGCASTAMVTTWKPTEVLVEDVGRIALCSFSGSEDLAPLAWSTVKAKLEESETYEIIDTNSQPAAAAVPPMVDASSQSDWRRAVQWGQTVGADTVLVGHVRAVQRGYDLGGKTVYIGDFEVKAALTLDLIDVHTGQRRYHDQRQRSYLGESDLVVGGSNSKAKVLAGLARQCAEEAADRICARPEKTKVKLASAYKGPGASDIRRGIKLARQDDWDGARRAWQAALAENPTSSAATYNLGVAFEALHDDVRARHQYAVAYSLTEDQRYRQAMLRVDRRRHETQAATQVVAQEPFRQLAGSGHGQVGSHATSPVTTTRYVPATPICRLLPPPAGGGSSLR